MLLDEIASLEFKQKLVTKACMKEISIKPQWVKTFNAYHRLEVFSMVDV